MDEYKVADHGKLPELIGSFLGYLNWAAKFERPLIAKFAQTLLDDLVSQGYLVPDVWWAVRDTKDGTFAAKDLPSRPAALAKRRELGGTSARYRVEPLYMVAPPEEP